jgi:oligopeptide/dipeptide ABC transporter ATP-binding protein
VPSGCRFAPRCTSAREICRAAVPPLRLTTPGHEAACVLVGAAAP